MTEKILKIGEMTIPLSEVPEDVLNLIEIYKKWEQDCQTQRLEMYKTEAAMRGLTVEIEIRLKGIQDESK